MKAIGAYRTTGGGWAAYDKLGRTWRVEEVEGIALEAARTSRPDRGGRAR